MPLKKKNSRVWIMAALATVGAIVYLVTGFVHFLHDFRRYSNIRRTDDKAEVFYRLGSPARVTDALDETDCSKPVTNAYFVAAPANDAAIAAARAAPSGATAPDPASNAAATVGSIAAPAPAEDTAAVPSSAPEGPRILLPANRRIEDFDYWLYDLGPKSGQDSRLRVQFDHANALVKLVSCVYIDDQSDTICPPLAGIAAGATEDRVRLMLGTPTSVTLNGLNKTLAYEDLGVNYVLTKGKVCIFQLVSHGTNDYPREFWRYLYSLVADIRQGD